MRGTKPMFLIWLVAVIAAGTGLYEALPDFGLNNLEYITSAFRFKDWGIIAWFPLGLLLNPAIPVAKLIAAIGLVRLQSWAWRAAIIPLVVDLLLRLTGAINFAVQAYRYREFRIPKDAQVVGVVSMWPSYLIGFLCAFAILLLLRPSMKRKFEKVVENVA